MTPMVLSTGVVLDCPPRFGTERNLDRRTLGAEVAQVAVRLGRPLMPWQQYVVDVALELDDDGDLWYDELDLQVERRQGKTSLILPVLVHRCRVLAKLWGPQIVAYTAQDGNRARKKWETDQVYRIDRSAYGPLGKGRVAGKHGTVRLSNGSEGITWNNGSTHFPTPPTETAGHGDDVDVAVIDEAWAHVDDRVEQAFEPAMMARRSTQLWRLSAAGTDRSQYWWPLIVAGRRECSERGRQDGFTHWGPSDTRHAFFEWSIGDDEDYRDPDVWKRRMPALGHTVRIEKVASALAKIERGEDLEDRDEDDEGAADVGLERFLRPYLGRWCRWPSSDKRPSAVRPERWLAARRRDVEMADPVAFGIEVADDRGFAVIAAAGRCGAGVLVDAADSRAGTDWIVPRIVELVDKWSPVGVGVVANGPGGALIPALRRALGDRLELVELSSRDYQRSCADFLDALGVKDDHGNLDPAVVHLGQDHLDAAVGAAARKLSPDTGGWQWDRKSAAVDITPLIAVTVARWVSLTVEPPAPVSVGGFVDPWGDD